MCTPCFLFCQILPRRPGEKERQPPMVRSRSSSMQCHREVQRSEPSPMAPPRKDWGPRSRPPVCTRRRIYLSLTAMASRSQAPDNSSSSSRTSSEARPSSGEFGQTAQAYLPLSMWPPDSDLNCPAAYCTSGDFRPGPQDAHFLRHSAHHSLQRSSKSHMTHL